MKITSRVFARRLKHSSRSTVILIVGQSMFMCDFLVGFIVYFTKACL